MAEAGVALEAVTALAPGLGDVLALDPGLVVVPVPSQLIVPIPKNGIDLALSPKSAPGTRASLAVVVVPSRLIVLALDLGLGPVLDPARVVGPMSRSERIRIISMSPRRMVPLATLTVTLVRGLPLPRTAPRPRIMTCILVVPPLRRRRSLTSDRSYPSLQLE